MILVDGITTHETPLRHKQWSHMVSTLGELELRDMAARIGLKDSWFQRGSFDHFDITPPRRAKAIKLGAIEVTSRALLFGNYDYGRRRQVRPCEACATAGGTGAFWVPGCVKCDLAVHFGGALADRIRDERRNATLR